MSQWEMAQRSVSGFRKDRRMRACASPCQLGRAHACQWCLKPHHKDWCQTNAAVAARTKVLEWVEAVHNYPLQFKSRELSPVSVGSTAQWRADANGAGNRLGRPKMLSTPSQGVRPHSSFSKSLPGQAGLHFHFSCTFLGSEFSRHGLEKTSWTMCVSPDARNRFKQSIGCTALLFPSRILPAGKTHRFCWPTPTRKGSRRSSKWCIAGKPVLEHHESSRLSFVGSHGVFLVFTFARRKVNRPGPNC